jgi:hypothetical protein
MRKYPCMHKLENITVIEERRNLNTLCTTFDDGSYRLKNVAEQGNINLRRLTGRLVRGVTGKGVLMTEFKLYGGNRIFMALNAIAFMETRRGLRDVETKVGVKGMGAVVGLRLQPDAVSDLLRKVKATRAQLSMLEFKDPVDSHKKRLIYSERALMFVAVDKQNLTWQFGGPRAARRSFPVCQEDTGKIVESLQKNAEQQNMVEILGGGKRLYARRDCISEVNWDRHHLGLKLGFQQSANDVPVVHTMEFWTPACADRADAMLKGQSLGTREIQKQMSYFINETGSHDVRIGLVNSEERGGYRAIIANKARDESQVLLAVKADLADALESHVGSNAVLRFHAADTRVMQGITVASFESPPEDVTGLYVMPKRNVAADAAEWVARLKREKAVGVDQLSPRNVIKLTR